MPEYKQNIITELTEDFLTTNLYKAAIYIFKTRNCKDIAQAKEMIVTPTIVYETESGYINGVLYNMLGEFNGHYGFIVNPNTFEYQIRQESYYGSFTYTTEPWDDKVYKREDLSSEQILIIEGCLAKTIIGCSQYAREFLCSPIQFACKRSQMLVDGKVKPDNF